MACGKGCETARKVLTWINWASLGCCSIYQVYFCLLVFQAAIVTRLLVSFYIICFAVIGLMFEFGQPHTRKSFSFLGTLGGRASVFCLSGTLGLSFSFPLTYTAAQVAFCMSIFSLFVAFFNLGVMCCGTHEAKASDELPVRAGVTTERAEEMSAPSHPPPPPPPAPGTSAAPIGPNRI